MRGGSTGAGIEAQTARAPACLPAKTAHEIFCALANAPTCVAHLRQIVQIAASAAGADVGSISVSSRDGMTILAPFNFAPPKADKPWNFQASGYGPDDFFSDPDLRADSYIAERGIDLCGKRLTSFARMPITIRSQMFRVALIVARTARRDPRKVDWPSTTGKELLMATAVLASGLLGGIAALAEAKVNDGASTGQLARELDGLSFPAALFDEERVCLACNDLFRGYVGTAVEPVGSPLTDLHLAPCALSRLECDTMPPPFVELANEFQDRGTPARWTMLWTEIPASDRASPVVMLALGDDRANDGIRHRLEEALTPDASAGTENREPTLRFLRETLVSRTIVRRRRTMSYVTVRSWCRSIKRYQIEALRAVKEHPTPEAVDAVAAEIEAALLNLIGFRSFSAIVAMPGGNSGLQRSFSVRVGEALSRRTGLPLLPALALETKRGSSHPKQNLRRPKLTLSVAPSQPVLVIDDVATSGQHLEEAVTLLRPTAGSVFAVAWIGGDAAT